MKTPTVRVIGGKYRGRQLDILHKEGLRPTTDRIRENIFNILDNHINGAKVLDLFAGTGVLGLEAISRGALELTAIEKDKENYLNLKKQMAVFNDNIEVINMNAISYLSSCTKIFDIIFIDPPFSSNLINESLYILNSRSLIKESTLIYIENSTESNTNYPNLMSIRDQKIGNVRFGIYKKTDFLF